MRRRVESFPRTASLGKASRVRSTRLAALLIQASVATVPNLPEVFAREDNTGRFFVGGEAGADDVVRPGFRWLAEYAGANDHPHAALVLPGVKNAAYLDRILGPSAAKRLQKDRRLVTPGLTIEMFTESKPPGAFEGPMLAVWT